MEDAVFKQALVLSLKMEGRFFALAALYGLQQQHVLDVVLVSTVIVRFAPPIVYPWVLETSFRNELSFTIIGISEDPDSEAFSNSEIFAPIGIEC